MGFRETLRRSVWISNYLEASSIPWQTDSEESSVPEQGDAPSGSLRKNFPWHVDGEHSTAQACSQAVPDSWAAGEGMCHPEDVGE